jgi:hypothetical protein
MKSNLIASTMLALAAGAAMLPQTAHAQSFAFSQKRSRLVVLIHGVTARPNEDPEAKIGTSGHARYYWGFDFIKALQGRTDETDMRVLQPRVFGSMVMSPWTKREDWLPEKTTPNPADYAPICFPVSWLSNVPNDITTNKTLQKDYIRLITKNAGANTSMVMVASRDGSRPLIKQLGDTIDQVYMSYQIAFGDLAPEQQPQMYLVGHSFGGVIARGILANPTGADFYGNKLTASQRTRAQFLRDRVVLVQTLAAPHEGTIIPDFTGDAHDFIAANGANYINGLKSFISFQPWRVFTGDFVRSNTAKQIDDILKAMSGKRDSLDEIMRMPMYNAGILNPETAKRTDGSYVPIYTAAGRNPGGHIYDRSRSMFLVGGMDYNPLSMLDILMNGTRHGKESSALHLIEGFLHLKGYGKEGKRPWGTATTAQGDRVSSPYAGFGTRYARQLSDKLTITGSDVTAVANMFFEGGAYTMGKADGEFDSDGFLGWDSAHAIHLNTNWYRVVEPSLYGNELPWDNDNHGSLMFNPGIGGWIHNELLRDAGPIVAVGKRRSVWTASEPTPTPLKSIKIQVSKIEDWGNKLDFFSQADFKLRIRAGGSEAVTILPEDMKSVTNIPAFNVTGYPGTIIPIRIDVIERDTPDPDDICMASYNIDRSSIFLNFDTRTNRITGDYFADAGESMAFFPRLVTTDNKVIVTVKVTQN